MWRAAGVSPAAARPDVRHNPPKSMKKKQQRKSSYRCRKVPRSCPSGVKDLGGRPRGSLKRFPFVETRLGFMLRYEVPAVYDLIVRLSPPSRRQCPYPTLVEAVCAASTDPALRKPKFRRYMDEYIRDGVYCRRGKRLTPERARYYERLRERRLEEYILKHWDEIELRRRGFELP